VLPEFDVVTMPPDNKARPSIEDVSIGEIEPTDASIELKHNEHIIYFL
jgi:hypothetical protein